MYITIKSLYRLCSISNFFYGMIVSKETTLVINYCLGNAQEKMKIKYFIEFTIKHSTNKGYELY